MALVKCKECGHQVSSKAEKCPQCGAKVAGGGGLLGGIVRIFLLFVLIVAAVGYCQGNKTSSSGSAGTPNPTVASLPESPPTWDYSTQTDDMSGKPIAHARIQSANLIEFEFPYAGPQRATLSFRKHPRWGKDIYLSVREGQFQCNSYDGCAVMVRFDDGQARSFKATEPESNDTTTLFIQGHDQFLAAAKKAKVIRIEAGFFHQGNRTFEFQAAGLNWPPADGKTKGAAASGGAPKDDQMKVGEKIYNANCAVCHQPTGKGMSPHFPSLVGSAVVKGAVDAQITQVLKGKNLMPPFSHLSNADIAAVITFTRNSWDNSGDVVQADQVKALRGK